MLLLMEGVPVILYENPSEDRFFGRFFGNGCGIIGRLCWFATLEIKYEFPMVSWALFLA